MSARDRVIAPLTKPSDSRTLSLQLPLSNDSYTNSCTRAVRSSRNRLEILQSDGRSLLGLNNLAASTH
jgi:hypothetical protein